MTISVPQTEKRCTHCYIIKPVSEFSPRYTHSYTSWCRDCLAERRRSRYDSEKAYVQHLQFTYGLSADQYLCMYHAQNGRCAACRDRLELRARTRIVVDHDHKTGRVRGLLCNACNSALGMLKDDYRRIQSLSRYLKKFDKKPSRQIPLIQPVLWDNTLNIE